MSIINTFPTTIANGQVEDATVVMSLFAWIQSQTNGNACPATTGSSILKGNGAGGTITATAGTDYSGGTQALATGIVKSTTGTGALTIAVAGTDYSAGTQALATGIVKSTTGTGALTTAVAGDFPTLNQSTSGNAATATTAGALSAVSALPNGTSATTQAVTDTSSSVATDAFVVAVSVSNGQTLNDVTGSRASGTTYTNNTGRPIVVTITETSGSGGAGGIQGFVNGVNRAGNSMQFPGAGWPVSITMIVPRAGTYGYTRLGAFSSLSNWSEFS